MIVRVVQENLILGEYVINYRKYKNILIMLINVLKKFIYTFNVYRIKSTTVFNNMASSFSAYKCPFIFYVRNLQLSYLICTFYTFRIFNNHNQGKIF